MRVLVGRRPLLWLGFLAAVVAAGILVLSGGAPWLPRDRGLPRGDDRPRQEFESRISEAPVQVSSAGSDASSAPGPPTGPVEVHEVSGVVVRYDGTPAEGAEIRGADGPVVHADERGEFHIGVPFEGATLTVRAPGHEEENVSVGPSAESLRIRLSRSPCITGSVTTDEGVPVPNWPVSVVGGQGFALTNRDGKYCLGGMGPRGPVTVKCLYAEDARSANVWDENVNFAIQVWILGVRVVDVSGVPIPSGWLKYTGLRGGVKRASGQVPVREGRAEIAFAPSESARVTALIDGYERKTVTIEPDRASLLQECTLVLGDLGGGGDIELVVEPAGGRAVGVVYVRIETAEGEGVEGWEGKRVGVESGGHAYLRGVPSGVGRIRVETTQGPWEITRFECPWSSAVSVNSGEGTRVRVVFELGGWVCVRTTDRGGRIVAPLPMEIRGGEGGSLEVLFWGKADGRWVNPLREPGLVYSERPLSPGSYLLEVHGDGERVVFDGKEARRVDVRPGSVSEVTVVVDK